MTRDAVCRRWHVVDRDGERIDGVTAPSEERARSVVRGVYPGVAFTLVPARPSQR